MTSVISLMTLMGPLLSSIAVQFWSFENFYSALGFTMLGFSIVYTIIIANWRQSSANNSLENPLLKKDDDLDPKVHNWILS